MLNTLALMFIIYGAVSAAGIALVYLLDKNEKTQNNIMEATVT